MRVVASLSLAVAGVTASTVNRTLTGDVVIYGVPGRTSAGKLKVKPGALRFPDPLHRVKLTKEHDRGDVRGHLVQLHEADDRIRASLKVSEGATGDQALLEADDRTRDGLSFDVVDVTIDGDTITDALVVAIGQVGIPAYDDSRIDQIAASQDSPKQEGSTMLTEQQQARLAALQARTELDQAEQAELAALQVLAGADPVDGEAAPAADAAPAAATASASPVGRVAASIPAVPGGVPAPSGAAQVQETGAVALRRMIADVTAAMQGATGNGRVAGITAALADVTHTAHTSTIEPVAWSGELWSGLQYVPEWSDLLAPGTLTNFEGKGWRFGQKLEMQDYAGDKAPIPTSVVTTEPSSYEAARMAVGIDIDRKFFDFPNQAFIAGLFEQARESWEIQKDGKARAYMLANAVAATRPLQVGTTTGDATLTAAPGSFGAADVGATITGPGIPVGTTIVTVTSSSEVEMSAAATATGAGVTVDFGAQAPSLLKAAARVSMSLKRRRVGKAGYIVANDEDMFTLLDIAEKDVPQFLQLWGIAPEDFRSSPDVPAGTVIGGVKQAAVLRTLPGSPIRVDAQNLANGGVDQAFFGYWAIEEHHPQGIATAQFRRA